MAERELHFRYAVADKSLVFLGSFRGRDLSPVFAPYQDITLGVGSGIAPTEKGADWLPSSKRIAGPGNPGVGRSYR